MFFITKLLVPGAWCLEPPPRLKTRWVKGRVGNIKMGREDGKGRKDGRRGRSGKIRGQEVLGMRDRRERRE